MSSIDTKYSNTIMYKIICNNEAIKDIYIGSTINLAKRIATHKSLCIGGSKNRGSQYKLYDTINQNGGWLNWSVIEIEKYPCHSAGEARYREQHWYEILNPTLNSQYPSIHTTIPSKVINIESNDNMIKNEKARFYYQKYKEKKKLQMKEYSKTYISKKTKEEKKEYMRQYRINKKNIELSKNWMFDTLTALN